MLAEPSTLADLRDEVRSTQRLLVQTASNDDADTEEWSFIEKKLSVISNHLAHYIQQQKMDDMSESDRTMIKLIHQYYIEMVDLIATKKRSVSEELRDFGNRERLEAAYK